MLRRLTHIVLNPFFQALVVALAVLSFNPFGLKKYQALEVDMASLFMKNQFSYADLDHDGVSELVQTFYNTAGNVGLSIMEGNATAGQWNFRGIFKEGSSRLMIGDYNGNTRDEIYVFTLSVDSVLLHILEYGSPPRLILSHRFICKIGKNLKDPDYDLHPGGIADMTGDSLAEAVFSVSAGFSKQPRKVYFYDIRNDSLHQSPESGAFITGLSLTDLDDDHLPEILLSTFASDNYNEYPFLYTDTSAWFMALDHDLQFLFPPAEFPHPTGNLQLMPLINQSGQKLILGFYSHASVIGHPGKFFISDPRGKILKEKEIGPDDILFNSKLIGHYGNNLSKAILVTTDQGFTVLDEMLNPEFEARTDVTLKNAYLYDIDLDDKKEIIYPAPGEKQHVILRQEFSHPVFIDFPLQLTTPVFSMKINGENPSQLSVMGDQIWKHFDYGINPMWRFRFVIWIGVYLAILGFILIIRKLYSFQLKKRYETERKISRLQLSIVKAQMEPHFIMNTINTIGSSIYRQKPDEAYQLLVNFSGMVRSLLVSSDKLTRTFGEELEFVKNYLDLEKTRFEGMFTYSVNVEENIDPGILVPKMIIQLHTENALKHGLLPKKSSGVLEIDLVSEPGYIVIIIKDNGIGRSAAAKARTSSTGKGMKIMEQLFDTYNRHNQAHIRQEIIDLADDENRPAGTMVRIHLPVPFNPEIY